MKLGLRDELCPRAITIYEVWLKRFFIFKNTPPQRFSVFSSGKCFIQKYLHPPPQFRKTKSTGPRNEADVALECGTNRDSTTTENI